jgi:hypothetical protein
LKFSGEKLKFAGEKKSIHHRGGERQHPPATVGGGVEQRVRRAAQRRPLRLPGVGHHGRERAARAEASDGAAPPSIVRPPVEHLQAHGRRPRQGCSFGSRVDGEPCRRQRLRRGGRGGGRRQCGPRQRQVGGLFEGDKGRLAVGQPLQRRTSSSHVPPYGSRPGPAQRTSTCRRPQCIRNLSRSCSLGSCGAGAAQVLRCWSRGCGLGDSRPADPRRYGRRLATETRRWDFEEVETRRWDFEEVDVGHRAREHLKWPIQRGERSSGRGARSLSRSTSSPRAKRTSRRCAAARRALPCAGPAGRLPLLQQRQHLGRHAPHQISDGLAGPGRVRRRRRDEGATGMLAAIGVEGRVPGAEWRRGVNDGELDQLHEVRPVARPLAGNAAQHF